MRLVVFVSSDVERGDESCVFTLAVRVRAGVRFNRAMLKHSVTGQTAEVGESSRFDFSFCGWSVSPEPLLQFKRSGHFVLTVLVRAAARQLVGAADKC